MRSAHATGAGTRVALLAEGVDRNQMQSDTGTWIAVALLAEGVDRNFCTKALRGRSRVALLAEGVDRNNAGIVVNKFDVSRPPRGGRG